ncbi:MAG: putative membrane protein [Enterobacterales bacterium]|jgi:uncharacterized membrane protein
MTTSNNSSDNDLDSNISEPQIKQLPASTGLKWVAQSFSLLSKSPSTWLIMWIIAFLFNVAFVMSSYLILLPALLSATFTAGFIYGAKVVDSGFKLKLEHLFIGFKVQLRNLFRLGLLYLMFSFLLGMLFSLILSNSIDEAQVIAMSELSHQELQLLLAESPEQLAFIVKALLMTLVLSTPLFMASWFAPTLVFFHKTPPLRAMLLSFKACNTNLLPFLLYGLVIMPMILIAIFSVIGLPLILVIINISQYCSYKSVFNVEPGNKPSEQEGTFIV